MTIDHLGKLKGPAIGLIITVAINVVYALLNLFAAISQIVTGNYSNPLLSGSENQGAYIFGLYLGMAVSVLNLLCAPVIVYGAIQMMRGKSLGLSKTASILAIVPLTSCCFILGAPFGIWALVAMSKPEVKNMFK